LTRLHEKRRFSLRLGVKKSWFEYLKERRGIFVIHLSHLPLMRNWMLFCGMMIVHVMLDRGQAAALSA
jgi:hypothetical protein